MREHDDLIPMWDGRQYARSRIDEHWQQTAEYALEHLELKERVEHDSRLIRTHYKRALLLGAGVCLLLVICPAVAMEGASVPRLLIGLAVGAVGYGLAGGMAVLVQVPFARKALPITLCVRDGVLQVETPDTMRSVPLRDVQWELGSPYYGNILLFASGRKAIVITFPPEGGRFTATRLRVTCGLTDEMREHWTALLTLSRVPQRLNRKSRPRRVRGQLRTSDGMPPNPN